MGPRAAVLRVQRFQLCQAVPVDGPGAALDVLSSWCENSCDSSDPGGGEQHGHRETLTSKHSKTPRLKRKPWDITGQRRWPQRQTTLTSLAGILSVMLPPYTLTLTPVRAPRSLHLLWWFERSI